MATFNLYGKTYCENENEVMDTVFNGTSTANGTYKKTRNGIIISDLAGKELAFIWKNGRMGPVSYSKHDGKDVIYCGCNEYTSKWLNVPNSLIEEIEGVRMVTEYIYKK